MLTVKVTVKQTQDTLKLMRKISEKDPRITIKQQCNYLGKFSNSLISKVSTNRQTLTQDQYNLYNKIYIVLADHVEKYASMTDEELFQECNTALKNKDTRSKIIRSFLHGSFYINRALSTKSRYMLLNIYDILHNVPSFDEDVQKIINSQPAEWELDLKIIKQNLFMKTFVAFARLNRASESSATYIYRNESLSPMPDLEKDIFADIIKRIADGFQLADIVTDYMTLDEAIEKFRIPLAVRDGILRECFECKSADKLSKKQFRRYFALGLADTKRSAPMSSALAWYKRTVK